MFIFNFQGDADAIKLEFDEEVGAAIGEGNGEALDTSEAKVKAPRLKKEKKEPGVFTQIRMCSTLCSRQTILTRVRSMQCPLTNWNKYSIFLNVPGINNAKSIPRLRQNNLKFNVILNVIIKIMKV